MTLGSLLSRPVSLLAIGLAVSAVAGAKDLRVPSEYGTIQAALSAAQPGDRVLVAPGVFQGPGNVDLDFFGKAVTLQGAGYLSTIIDGQGVNRGIIFHSGETSSSVVRSLTLRHCQDSVGAAIAIQNASPLISQCAIEDSSANSGGGVYISGGSPKFWSVRFTRNNAILGGGAFYSDQASPLFEKCTFRSNATRAAGGAGNIHGGEPRFVACSFSNGTADFGGAGLSLFGSSVSISNSAFSQNGALQKGGAINLAEHSEAVLVNCTLAANLSRRDAGAVNIEDGSSASIKNSIFWGNAPTCIQGNAAVSYSCVQDGWPGAGNIDDDPKIVDAISEDLHLANGSPCVDNGDSGATKSKEDLDGRPRKLGSAIDMGAYEFPILRPVALPSVATRTTYTILHDGSPETNTARVTLRATGYDQLLGTLSFQWQIENEVVSSSDTASFDMEAGSSEVLLEARDSTGQVAQSRFYVTVYPEPNQAPTASAGRDQTVSASGTVKVALHGRGFDADGDPLTYQWSNGATTQDTQVELAPGDYTYSLKVTDPYGASSSDSVHITVKGNSVPVVTLKGSATMSVEALATWSDPGATATDVEDGSLAVRVAGTVDTSTVGSYTLVYSAADSDGNEGSAKRVVTVADTEGPVITLKGANSMAVECGQGYSEPGATSIDAFDGVVAVTITGSVSSAKGTYTVTYTATDKAGNTGTATRTVTVSDTKAPVITLKGSSSLTVDLASGSYVEQGATAADSCDGSLPVSISGSVPAAVGTYALTYRATDSSGNSASATRTVTVVSSAGPSISGLAASPSVLNSQNQKMRLITLTYTVTSPADPSPTIAVSCTSSDADSGVFTGDIAGDIQILSKTTLNVRDEKAPSKTRTYTITVKVTDKNGKSASASVTVTVR